MAYLVSCCEPRKPRRAPNPNKTTGNKVKKLKPRINTRPTAANPMSTAPLMGLFMTIPAPTNAAIGSPRLKNFKKDPAPASPTSAILPKAYPNTPKINSNNPQ